MVRSRNLAAIAVILGMLVPVVALAHPGAPAHLPTLLPKPHISVTRALVLAQRDVRLHGSLAAHGGYISGVDYGHLRKLSSGAKVKGAGPQTLVWAITYTDPATRSRSRQIIDATSGKMLTRVYYAPGLP
jgi:hypothetical protein